jgi:undecaprenyl diphosphate synthase
MEGFGAPGWRTSAPDALAGIDRNRIPTHVAAVMDGNGRWAQQRGLKRTDGHAAGEEALFDVVEGALELGIGWLTVYAFSTENWKRPVDEVRFLMQFNEGILTRHRDRLNEWGVRIRFAGRRDWRVPRRVLKRMDESIALTRGNRRMTFTIAFNYGGRAEIVDAVKALVEAGVPADKISNFLLWELAYSELVFTDILWPDFRRADLFDAVREYQGRDRRFGGVE